MRVVNSSSSLFAFITGQMWKICVMLMPELKKQLFSKINESFNAFDGWGVAGGNPGHRILTGHQKACCKQGSKTTTLLLRG